MLPKTGWVRLYWQWKHIITVVLGAKDKLQYYKPCVSVDRVPDHMQRENGRYCSVVKLRIVKSVAQHEYVHGEASIQSLQEALEHIVKI